MGLLYCNQFTVSYLKSSNGCKICIKTVFHWRPYFFKNIISNATWTRSNKAPSSRLRKCINIPKSMSSGQVDGFNDRKGLKTTTSPHFLKKTRGEKGEWESCTSLQIILPFLSTIITVSMTSSAVSMGSRSFILWNPNQGTERKPAPSRYEKSHWETHSQWWMLHMRVKVWVLAQSHGITLIAMKIQKRPLKGHHIQYIGMNGGQT